MSYYKKINDLWYEFDAEEEEEEYEPIGLQMLEENYRWMYATSKYDVIDSDDLYNIDVEYRRQVIKELQSYFDKRNHEKTLRSEIFEELAEVTWSPKRLIYIANTFSEEAFFEYISV